MNPDDIGNFLSRWSRRKLKQADLAPEPQPAAGSPAVSATDAAPVEPLPPVESLTPESDFKPFMRPDVESGLKQAALKQLFKDPHFNVMDGLDTYIEDYSIPDPIPDDMMQKLYQARQHVFSPEQKAAAEKADAEADAAAEAAHDASAKEIQAQYAAPEAPAAEPLPAPDQKA